MPFALSPDRERKLQEILERYPTKMAATLPLLHLCQEQEGYVGDEVIEFVSRRLDLPPAHVKGVVTFYTLYNQHPVGKHQVWVCRTLPCALRGAYDVIEHCEKRLGIHVRRDDRRRQGHPAHGRVPRELRHRADDAGRQGLLREPHARARRRDPQRASGELRRMLKRTELPDAHLRQARGLDAGDLRARARRLRGRRGACSRR